jgi:hypothetical protein
LGKKGFAGWSAPLQESTGLEQAGPPTPLGARGATPHSLVANHPLLDKKRGFPTCNKHAFIPTHQHQHCIRGGGGGGCQYPRCAHAAHLPSPASSSSPSRARAHKNPRARSPPAGKIIGSYCTVGATITVTTVILRTRGGPGAVGGHTSQPEARSQLRRLKRAGGAGPDHGSSISNSNPPPPGRERLF